jgi:transcriptional regulator with XRE-family HTH domain
MNLQSRIILELVRRKTQREVAEACGLSRHQLYRILQNNPDIREQAIACLSRSVRRLRDPLLQRTLQLNYNQTKKHILKLSNRVETYLYRTWGHDEL